jgi:hypothetical protein
MFAFGSEIDGEFIFVSTSDGHTYTYPSEKVALEYFGCVKSHSHLYQLPPDLSVARLVKQGDNLNGSPAEVEPTNKQRTALWSSYVYKSMLEWVPYPSEVRP